MSDDLHGDMARAARAEALMRNELLTEALAELERSYIEAWKNSDARDVEGRELLWHRVQAAAALPAHLRAVMADGRLAQKQIEELSRVEPRPAWN